jgi:hypothetical protein
VLRVGKNKRDPITEGPKVRKPKKRRGIGNSATESVFGKKRKEKGCSVFFFFFHVLHRLPPENDNGEEEHGGSDWVLAVGGREWQCWRR